MARVIKKGETRKNAAVNKLLKAITAIGNSDKRDTTWNNKNPEKPARELFTEGEGVNAALNVLLDRINYMKAP